ncbi:transglycosylase domain-containing protein [Lacticaseibacillus daqingensis]|uniref:transglycosylase domain-containing protein n=1 Tax=Lacticaseibacillus daqingensis TaxID=2486014 RepID=UPI000F76E1DE|nr:PBP1A family penicillin-binding protein [Lacticaseibacillus daqingensis]
MAKTTPSRVASRRTRKDRPTPKKKSGRVMKVFKVLVLAFVAVLVAGLGLFAWYAKDAPAVTKADLMRGGSTVFYATNGKAITNLGTENRVYATADKIPQQLKDAVVAIEDRRFYSETLGIDPIRIAGAALSNVKARLTGNFNGLEGGSTLTQQLVKLTVFSTKASDQTIKRKAQEAWLAMKVERAYSKEQILEFYINKVYMNNGQVGMATGAQYYFGKSLSELTLGQTAFIAGLAQSPAGYDPYVYPDRAKARRDAVLGAMLRDDKISQSDAAKAKATPITDGLKPKTTTTNESAVDKVIDSYLTSVIKEVKAKTGNDPYTDNMKIYTNMDYDTQKELYDIVNSTDTIGFNDDKMQTAVTLSDPRTGAIIAQIGGRKTGDVRLAYNRATRNDRSNGSTMKPLMDYAPAIEYLNYSTYQQFDDTPYSYPGTNTPLYDVDRDYLGRISIRKALELSRNIVAIKVLDEVGLSRSLNFLKGLGITLPADQQVYASGIGASVTTEQEAAAYGALANGGTYYKPSYVKKVVMADGKTINFDNTGTRAMKSSTAYMVTDMLKGVISRGTGQLAQISGLYQAGKTGTTNYSDEEFANNSGLRNRVKDSWFTGYTQTRVASVWIGYDKAQQNGISPAEEAIPKRIYRALMRYTTKNQPNKDWVKPANVVVAHILTGSDPGTAVSGDTSGTTRELYVRGYGPTTQKAVTASSSTSSSSASTSTSSTTSSESSSVISTESSSEQPSSGGTPSDASSEPSKSSSSAATGSSGEPGGTDPGGQR